MGELALNGFEISGTTANRPDNVEEGQLYFNETLGVWQVRNAAGTPAWQGAYIGTKWPMAAFGLWGIDVDGARTNGGGIVGDVTLTNAAAAFAKTFDASEGASGTVGNIAVAGARAGYANNFQLIPDSPEENDYAAFGGAVPFCELAFNMSVTVAVYDEAAVLAWEYSDGAGSWASLTLATDQTDTDAADGARSFQQDGALSFVPPSDWASVALDGQTAYWIRAVVQTGKGDNMTTSPLMQDVEHDIVTPLDGFTCPHGGTITGIRVNDGTTGTLQDGSTKFILMNFTTGAHSGPAGVAHTLASQRQDQFAVSLAVSTGDELGILNTEEDGTNEPINVMLELNVSAP